MFPVARLLLLAVAVSAAIVSARGLAQEPLRLPTPVAPTLGNGSSSAILRSLPQPPDLPGSLFAPAPPPTPPSPADTVVNRPYFVPDPLLDPPELPLPGWFAGAELDVLKPHVKNRLTDTVQNTAQVTTGTSTTVALGSAPLDWTASPRVFVGYRLPAGFGEIALAWRGLAARGNEAVPGSDQPTSLSSRLDFNMIDLDYSSREFSLWPSCDMKWTIGLRFLSLYFDSRTDQPLVQEDGSVVIARHESNSLCGAGPHAGLELAQRLGETGLAFVVRTDLTTDLVRIHQGFFALSTTPDGRTQAAGVRNSIWMNAPILNVQAGVNWQPSFLPAARFFLGYQYEYWWNVGSNETDSNSRGDLWDQGIQLQAAFRF